MLFRGTRAYHALFQNHKSWFKSLPNRVYCVVGWFWNNLFFWFTLYVAGLAYTHCECTAQRWVSIHAEITSSAPRRHSYATERYERGTSLLLHWITVTDHPYELTPRPVMDGHTVVPEPKIRTLVNKINLPPAVKGNRKTTSHHQIYTDQASTTYYNLLKLLNTHALNGLWTTCAVKKRERWDLYSAPFYVGTMRHHCNSERSGTVRVYLG